jgi:hypothetical protein
MPCKPHHVCATLLERPPVQWLDGTRIVADDREELRELVWVVTTEPRQPHSQCNGPVLECLPLPMGRLPEQAVDRGTDARTYILELQVSFSRGK